MVNNSTNIKQGEELNLKSIDTKKQPTTYGVEILTLI